MRPSVTEKPKSSCTVLVVRLQFPGPEDFPSGPEGVMMGKIVWNEGFDKSSHKREIRGRKGEIVRKATGAVRFVKDFNRPQVSFTGEEARAKQHRTMSSVKRDHVFPGALVKLVGEAKNRYNETFCHVVSEADIPWKSDYETKWGGKWWLVIMPSGVTATINSRDMIQLEPQNGNPEG